jgi:hypothetical protein
LGGICRSGLAIEDVVEPNHANRLALSDTMGHRSRFVSPYLRIKARKKGVASTRNSSLILPK